MEHAFSFQNLMSMVCIAKSQILFQIPLLCGIYFSVWTRVYFEEYINISSHVRITRSLRYLSSVPAASTRSSTWVPAGRIWPGEDVECITVQSLRASRSFVTGAPSAGREGEKQSCNPCHGFMTVP